MKIKVGGKYRTQSGYRVDIFIKKENKYGKVFVGSIDYMETLVPCLWTEDGYPARINNINGCNIVSAVDDGTDLIEEILWKLKLEGNI